MTLVVDAVRAFADAVEEVEQNIGGEAEEAFCSHDGCSLQKGEVGWCRVCLE